METRPSQTLQVIQRFNQAFVQHDGSLLEDLIADDCVMESVEPAPDGTRYVGRTACLEFWQKLANNRDGAFTYRRDGCHRRARHHSLALSLRSRAVAIGSGRERDARARWPDHRGARVREER